MTDAGLGPKDIDAVLVGYATTANHLMPANVLSESLGIRPTTSLGMSVGGATGLAMISHAVALIGAGRASAVLVAAGEDRASGQSGAASTATLSQVGHRTHEVPVGATVPAYYALLASRYLHKYGLKRDALGHLAVQMREHARREPGAHFRTPIDMTDVRSARSIASPLSLLDCCPRSDGGAAIVVTRSPGRTTFARIAGVGHANRHQHLVEADLDSFGAREASQVAFAQAGITVDELAVAGIYDPFTITLALLLEEIGLAEPGRAGACAGSGEFSRTGRLPVNTHGGLLSYGHCGVAGGLAHVVEVARRLRDAPGGRRAGGAGPWGLVHAEGGILSAHVSVVLEGATGG
jgi:acetyl-CoA acetyltransferase